MEPDLSPPCATWPCKLMIMTFSLDMLGAEAVMAALQSQFADTAVISLANGRAAHPRCVNHAACMHNTNAILTQVVNYFYRSHNYLT